MITRGVLRSKIAPMKKSYSIPLLFLLILCSFPVLGQHTKRVLFLGNSYTFVNNLPVLLANAAASTGKTLVLDVNAPGSYYLAEHATNPVSLAKIALGGWDNVVLQDQSLALAFPNRYLLMMPYYLKLDSIIKTNGPCVQLMFYSTWGRRNGDTYLCSPPDCPVDTWIERTYYQMDSVIEENYKLTADSLKASMTPVGTTWRYIRRNYPSIELFQPDESHPSLAGSYAAACCFYATIFRSDPSLITFNPGLPAADAANIRSAAKLVVYDKLPDWNVGLYDSLLDPGCAVLGIDDNNIKMGGWQVYPNPIKDVLYVRFSRNPGKVKIGVYSMPGMLIKEVDAAQITKIDFSEFPAGLYIIKLMNSQGAFKVLKN